MNFKEACSILGVASDATADTAKAKYKELAKKLHPDVNKEPGAEDKFKKVNEAYTRFQEGDKPEPVVQNRWPGGVHVQSPFGRQVFHEPENIDLYETISFKESVLGVKKEIKFSRQAKCGTCNGLGEAPKDNGCKNCGGRGQVTGRRGNMIFVTTCSQCQGRVKMETCKECKGRGTLHTDVSVHVSVPAGIQDGNILRLQGMGSFMGSMIGMDQYTDAFLHIRVVPVLGLHIEGRDVVTTLKVTLLEALIGCDKDVKTYDGQKDVQVPALSKNKDEILIHKMGVGGEGNQRVILEVSYPKDTSKLVKALKEEK